MADQRGILRIRGARVQHRFQPSRGAFQEKRSYLRHRSVYLVDDGIKRLWLVLAWEEVEIVCLGKLQQRTG